METCAAHRHGNAIGSVVYLVNGAASWPSVHGRGGLNRGRPGLFSAASRKLAAPAAGSQRSGSPSGNHLRARSVALRRGLRHPRHVVGHPRQQGLSVLATVVDEYSWGGQRLKHHAVTQCVRAGQEGGARRRGQHADVLAALLSEPEPLRCHMTPSGHLIGPRSPPGPHLQNHRRDAEASPTWSCDITARTGGFRGDGISVMGKPGVSPQEWRRASRAFALNAESLAPKVRQTSKFQTLT